MIWNKSAKHKRLNLNRNDVGIVQVFCNLRKFVEKLLKNAIVAERIFSLLLIQKK